MSTEQREAFDTLYLRVNKNEDELNFLHAKTYRLERDAKIHHWTLWIIFAMQVFILVTQVSNWSLL